MNDELPHEPVNNFKKYLPFYLVCAAIVLTLIVAPMLQHGMFLDGLLYTCVARNFGLGKGSLWCLHFSDSWIKHGNRCFVEHPPGGIALQGLFFYVFGDHLWVERLYSFLLMVVLFALMSASWLQLFPQNRQLFWLPVLLWLLIPVNLWGVRNGVLENTMSVFDMAAFLAFITGLKNERRQWVFHLLAGLFTWAATFSKGLPGAFPIVLPLLYALSSSNFQWRKIALQTLAIVSVPLLIYTAIFLLSSAAKNTLLFYVKERLLYRIAYNPTVEHRCYIIYRLAAELSLPAVMVALLLVIFKELPSRSALRWVWFCLLTGLSASLPLALTKVQRGFYLITSTPYFALAGAAIATQAMHKFSDILFERKKPWVIMTAIGFIAVIGGIIYSLWGYGGYSRDREKIKDVMTIGKVVPRGATIGTPPAIWNDWGLQCYFMRYLEVSLFPSKYEDLHFYLTWKDSLPPSPRWRKLPLNTTLFDLYIKEK